MLAQLPANNRQRKIHHISHTYDEIYCEGNYSSLTFCSNFITSVCLSVCLSVNRRIPTLLHGPGCKFEEWYWVPSSCALYWSDLQSVHGFRCYDNSAKREMSASACTRSMPGYYCLLSGDVCQTQMVKAKFHYASSFEAGSRLIADRFEAGRRQASNQLRTS